MNLGKILSILENVLAMVVAPCIPGWMPKPRPTELQRRALGMRRTMSVRITTQLVQALERLARQEKTSRSAMVERLVARAVEAQKKLPDPPNKQPPHRGPPPQTFDGMRRQTQQPMRLRKAHENDP